MHHRHDCKALIRLMLALDSSCAVCDRLELKLSCRTMQYRWRYGLVIQEFGCSEVVVMTVSYDHRGAS